MDIREIIRQEIDRKLQSKDIVDAQADILKIGSELALPSRVDNLMFMRRITYVYQESWTNPSSDEELITPRLSKSLFLKNMPYEHIADNVKYEISPIIDGSLYVPTVGQHEHQYYSIVLYCNSSLPGRIWVKWTGVIAIYLNDSELLSSNYLDRSVDAVVELVLEKGKNRLDILIYNPSGEKSFELNLDTSNISYWSIPILARRVWTYPSDDALMITIDGTGNWVTPLAGKLDEPEGFDFPVRRGLVIIEKARNDTTGALTYDVDFENIGARIQGQTNTTPPDASDAAAEEGNGMMIQLKAPSETTYTFWLRCVGWGYID